VSPQQWYRVANQQHLQSVDFFLLTTYLLSLVDVFFNRQSAYLWVQTVIPFSRLVPLFERGRFHTWASQEKRKEASPIL
jgi:hypothetical protein